MNKKQCGQRVESDRIQREGAPHSETNSSVWAFCDCVCGRCRKRHWNCCEAVLAAVETQTFCKAVLAGAGRNNAIWAFCEAMMAAFAMAAPKPKAPGTFWIFGHCCQPLQLVKGLGVQPLSRGRHVTGMLWAGSHS